MLFRSDKLVSAADNVWVGTDNVENIPGQARGSYVLLIGLADEETIAVGNRGDIRFLAGYYAYAGSAMNGLRHRLSRHIRKEKKKHWHIDYLLERAAIIDVAVHETDRKSECAIAAALGEPPEVGEDTRLALPSLWQGYLENRKNNN